MTIEPKLEIIGAALADPSRARILCTLMDGRAFTNKELASAAGISAQTASAHLRHLGETGLVTALRSGRFVYHRVANEEVAAVLETLATITPLDHLARKGRASKDIRCARSCYNHIAGRLGVLMAQQLHARGVIEMTPDGAHPGQHFDAFFATLGITVSRTKPPVRLCLDWTERRDHIAGPAAIALMETSFEQGWLRRMPTGRALHVTESGFAVFERHLGITRHMLAPESPVLKERENDNA